MKKTVYVVIIVLSVFSLIASSSALENKGNETALAKVYLGDSYSLKERLIPAKKLEYRYSIDYNLFKREQPFMREEERKEGRYKIHQPLVYNNSIDFSHEKISRPFKSSALDLEFLSILNGVKQGRVIQVGSAFLTTFAVHELGHTVVADYVGATGTHFDLLKKQDGKFFLGTTTFQQIDDKSRLPFSMGGVVASDLTFEHALQNYRENPTLYNKSLLFFSGTDFLWYCLYAFYLNGGHPYFDPIAITKQTGISKDMLFSIALAKTMINAYRVYSGQNRVIPYFTVDRYSAFLNISIAF